MLVPKKNNETVILNVGSRVEQARVKDSPKRFDRSFATLKRYIPGVLNTTAVKEMSDAHFVLPMNYSS